MKSGSEKNKTRFSVYYHLKAWEQILHSFVSFLNLSIDPYEMLSFSISSRIVIRLFKRTIFGTFCRFFPLLRLVIVPVWYWPAITFGLLTTWKQNSKLHYFLHKSTSIFQEILWDFFDNLKQNLMFTPCLKFMLRDRHGKHNLTLTALNANWRVLQLEAVSLNGSRYQTNWI